MVHIPMGRFGEAIEQAQAAVFRTSQGLIFSEQKALTTFKLAAMRAATSRFVVFRCVARVADVDTLVHKGTDFKVDGGISSCYVTPLGEPVLPPPPNLSAAK